MTKNHPFPQAMSFLASVEPASDLRTEEVRQPRAATAAKRVVHTSIIDAGWDLEPGASTANRSGEPTIHARAPRTSLIDSQWDPQPDSRVVHRSEAHRIDALAPQTPLIGLESDASVTAAPVVEQSGAPWVRVRPRQLALVDTEEELDPVITWFELDGPECLGLLESELV